MNKTCKCKSPKIKRMGNCYICDKCGGIIIKVRNTFHRKTSKKPLSKKYNRNTEKRKLKEEVDDV